MTTCERPGCDQPGRPTYCSRRCAGIVNAQKKPAGYFERLGAMGMKGRRQKGAVALRPSDLRLMAQGRFVEAARQLYDRGYSAGWIAAKTGRRQLPAREGGNDGKGPTVSRV